MFRDNGKEKERVKGLGDRFIDALISRDLSRFGFVPSLLAKEDINTFFEYRLTVAKESVRYTLNPAPKP